MKNILATFFLGSAILLTGCSTVIPPSIKDDVASYDDSTPAGYDACNGGFLGFADDDNTAFITDNARNVYNELIADYKEQFRDEYKLKLSRDDGISKGKDKFGNDLWKIDYQHLQYFMRLSRWAKEKRPVDSIWLKARHVIEGK